MCEKRALEAVLKSLSTLNVAEAQLFIRELPNLLNLPYPATKELYAAALQLIPQLKYIARMKEIQQEYIALDYLQDLLKNFEE